jgi:hypothetical protein
LNAYPFVKRTVRVKLGPEPLTKYSFIHNSNVWFGTGITIFGEVLVNGGIRMDGTNESIMRSAKATYTCGSETGCSQPDTKPGIWGHGGPVEMWRFPETYFDFGSIVTDFNAMKISAQTKGVYLPYNNGSYGYHFVFNNNGTVNIYEVTSAGLYKGWTVEDGCQNYYQRIITQNLIGSYSLSDKKIFYAENTVYVEGEVKGQATVVAARLPVISYSTDMWLVNPVLYTAKDGSDNLGLIAQNDILMAKNIPTDFEIDAALMAQSGRIVRPDYRYGSCTSGGQNAVRNSLTVYGTLISDQKSYWSFSDTHGVISGFVKREIIYNQNAAEFPPPYFPTTEDFKVLTWEEEY